MSSYRDFVQKARARFAEGRASSGGVVFTRHAGFKMRQYRLSEQKVRGVIRNPKRREEGIVKDTVAVMQPISPKRDAKGKETWKQEIWVMYKIANNGSRIANSESERNEMPAESSIRYSQFGIRNSALRVISAWRYPGVSPKRNPVPPEILREIEEGSILDEGITIDG